MKKILLIFAMLAVTMSVVAQTTFSNGNLTYKVLTAASGSTAGTVEVTGLSDTGKANSMLSLTIPATVTYGSSTYNIASIGERAFRNCTNITALTISSGEVKYQAFYGCTMIATINLKEGVTKLGVNCFHGAVIRTLTIPASVTSIDYSSLTELRSLTWITVSMNSTTFASYNGMLYTKDYKTLRHCPMGYTTAEPTFHASLEHVAPWAFFNVAALTRVTLPYGVTVIDREAFRGGCDNLKIIELPSTVNAIGRWAFMNLTGLEEFYINATTPVTIDKSDVFEGSSNPKLFVPHGMGEAYRVAGWTEFASINLSSVVASDYHNTNGLSFTVTSTESTGNYAGRCKVVRGRNYAEVSGATEIPATITLSGKQFAVTRIDTMAFHASNSYYVTGCSRIDTVGYAAFAYESNLVSITLPQAKVIDQSAFYNTPISAITLNQGLTTIADNAFRATQLKKIEIPDGVTTIGEAAFAECTSLETATVGEGITVVPVNLFMKSTKLTELTLPSTVTKISDGVLGDVPLTSLTVKAINPPTYVNSITSTWQNFERSNCVLNVPSGRKASYLTLALWHHFKDCVEMGGGSSTAVKGDVDGSGVVDITDVNMAINMVLGKTAKTSAADVDGSGTVDITDVNSIINIMLGK